MPANAGAQKWEIELLLAPVRGAGLTRTSRMTLEAPQEHRSAKQLRSHRLNSSPCGFPDVLLQVLNAIWFTLFSELAADLAWKGESIGCLVAPNSIFCKFAASCQKIIRVIFAILDL